MSPSVPAGATVVHIDLGAGFARKSLATQVYETLERAILAGQLPPATRLGEDAIASALSVSRSPVREAVAELERIGLAERLPNRDRRVAVPTEAFIVDVFDVWILLECERLCEASRAADPAAGRRLDELLDQIEALGGKGGRKREGLLVEFHRLLQQDCKNQQLHRVADEWYRYIRWFRSLFFDYHANASEAAAKEHREIARCFGSQDCEGLSAVMRRHIASHREAVLAAWRDTDAAELAASRRTLEFRLEGRLS